MIRFSCSCGKPFEVPEEHAGKKIRCRFCSAVSVVPPSSDPRASGHLEQLDWRTLGSMTVTDKVCLHCGTLVAVEATMCADCGEVFGWADTGEAPEVTMEVTDEPAEPEPETPELTQSGRFKHIVDVSDAPAQFEIVDIQSKPAPVALELLKLPHASKPAEVNPLAKNAAASEKGASAARSPAEKPAAAPLEPAETFQIEGVLEESGENKKEKPRALHRKRSISGRLRHGHKRRKPKR